MFRSYRAFLRVVIFLIVVTWLLSELPAAAQPQPIEHLIPIGGGYSDVYAGFAQAAAANARNNQIKILVLPLASASNPSVVTETERAALSQAAEERRFQIEEACKRAVSQPVTCQASLAPIFTRSDAEQRRLSGARWAHDREKLAGLDVDLLRQIEPHKCGAVRGNGLGNAVKLPETLVDPIYVYFVSLNARLFANHHAFQKDNRAACVAGRR